MGRVRAKKPMEVPRKLVPWFDRQFTLVDWSGSQKMPCWGPVSLDDIYNWMNKMIRNCTENDGVPDGFRL
jgi:hypothetical protein